MSDNIYKKWPPVSNAELLRKIKEAEQKKTPTPANENDQDGGTQEGYAVGYKRPPRHTQFKPGVSGNPRGRRKRPANIKQEIQQVYLRKIAVQDGQTKQHVPVIVLLYRKLLNDGLKGDKRAALAAAKMAEKFGVYEFAEKIEIDFSSLSPDENELMFRAGLIMSRLRGGK
jgi:hypothetical protein